MFETPILLLIFNRPEHTKEVFAAIKKTKPKKLFIAADGPRANREEEKLNCEKTRQLVLDGIDWECDVKTLFRDENLGCKYAVSGAISWFFQQVEEGIILEDDCLPDPTFFDYTSSLLKKYRNEEKVMSIGGSCYNSKLNQNSSYFFSHYVEIWGWATWRRAWNLYDVEMSSFPTDPVKDILKKSYQTAKERFYWKTHFELTYNKQIDTWDYQWCYCVRKNEGLAISPYTNLVSNIGFGDEATHTVSFDERYAGLETQPLAKLVHPLEIKRSLEDDKIIAYNKLKNQKNRFKDQLRNFVPSHILTIYRRIRGN